MLINDDISLGGAVPLKSNAVALVLVTVILSNWGQPYGIHSHYIDISFSDLRIVLLD